jgi:hypothetical protein
MSATPRDIVFGIVLGLVLGTIGNAAVRAEEIGVIALAPRIGLPSDTRLDRSVAKPMELLYAGPRYGVGGNSPLGEEQKEDFQLFDVAALFRLPWTWGERSSELSVESRLLTSGGQLNAAGQSSFMGTVVPALALTTPDGGISLDVGIGPGFFSSSKFGAQDFGGPVQIVGTAGLGINVVRGFHAGYRFQHFSDAGMYGPTSLGVDMHIMDLSYRF